MLILAITARVIDDRQDRIFEIVGSMCGTLEKFDKNGDRQSIDDLNLREACNKIIHANKVRFDVDEEAGQQYLNPFIYLYGDQNGKGWKATLDIIAFAKEYVLLVCRL